MNGRVTRARAVARAVVHEVRSENLTFMAGSIAYHAFVSLLPFLLLMLFVLSRVGGDQVAQELVRAMVAALAPNTRDGGAAFADLLWRAARNATRSAGLSLVGVAALVWATLRIFRGLDQAFSDIYESESENTIPDQLLDGTVVFVAIGLAILAVGALQSLVGLPSFGALDAAVRPAVTVASVAVALLPMYYVFPDEDVTVREVLPGTVLAAAGWTALSVGFRAYVALSSTADYGVVGVLVLFITWLYFAGLVLLAGAAVNAVLAGRSEDTAALAWGERADATEGDADFVTPLRTLDAADWSGEIRVRAGGTDVTLPAPDEATVRVTTVDRPRLLGGSREEGRVVLRWDSRE